MSCATQTIVNLEPDTMAGFDPQNLSRTKAPASDFNVSSRSNGYRGASGISFLQGDPSQGPNSGSFWNRTVEGQQYLKQDLSLSNGYTHAGVSSSHDSFNMAQDSQASQKASRKSLSGSNLSPWDGKLPNAQSEAHNMSRLPSQDSIGGHSHRANQSSANSYDQVHPMRMFPNVPQVSFNISSASSDVTARSNSPDSSTLYTPAQQMDTQPFNDFQFQGAEDLSTSHVFHRNSNSDILAHSLATTMTGTSYSAYATAGEDAFLSSLTAGSSILPNQGPSPGETGIYSSNTAIKHSPIQWDSGFDFLESQRSSPIQTEDPWALPAPQSLTTNSPLTYSPSLEGVSPASYVQDFPELAGVPPHTIGNRTMRKPVGPRQSKVVSDLASTSRHPRAIEACETSDDLKVMGRTSMDMDKNARVHYLYHNAAPQADGLYHCPWEGQDCCQHKPEKLKCNYDKFVDSHLKPYRCKVLTCETLQFSSTACLLRHEREAHAMHGHGEKPFLCTYEGCDRSVPGNGFPRHWNLRDHMRRVHNDPGQPKSNASGTPPPVAPPRSKKRKAGDRPDSPLEKERPVKRTPTPAIEEPRQPSLLEQYHQTEDRLLDAVKLLHNPKDPNIIKLLRNASDCIKVMAQTTQRINATPALSQTFTQQPS